MKDQETLDLLDRVIDSEEYISAVYGKMMDTIYQIMEKHADGIKLPMETALMPVNCLRKMH